MADEWQELNLLPAPLPGEAGAHIFNLMVQQEWKRIFDNLLYLREQGLNIQAGIQFVFQLTNSESPPALGTQTPQNRADSDFVPSGWSNNPASVSASNSVLWAAIRRSAGQEWTNFGAPFIWAHYTERGSDGVSYQYIYRAVSSQTPPATPTATAEQRRLDDYIPTGWSENNPGPSPNLRFIYISERKGTTGNWQPWSAPTLHTYYPLDGRPGAPGATITPGTPAAVQLAYRTTTTDSRPATPRQTRNEATQDNYLPTGWHRAPQDLSATSRYLWVSQRTRAQGLPGAATPAWGSWSTPALSARWATDGEDGEDGEQGEQGEQGPQGIITRFAYRRYATIPDAAPGAPTSRNYPPPNWTAAATGISSQFHAEYQISQTYNPATATASAWSTPALVSRWAVDGMDGEGFQYVFRRTTTDSRPATPTSTTSDRENNDYIPTGWTDDPVGPDTAHPIEWVSSRKGTDGDWGEWSRPAAFANFGVDGKTTEYIYRRTTTATAPDRPITKFRWFFGTIPNDIEAGIESASPTAAQLQAALDANDVEEVTSRVQFLDNQNRPVTGPDFSAVDGIGFNWDGSRHPDDHTHSNLFFASTVALTIRSSDDFPFAEMFTYTGEGWPESPITVWRIRHYHAKRITDAAGVEWTVYFIASDPASVSTDNVRSVTLSNFGSHIEFGDAVRPIAAVHTNAPQDDYTPPNWTDDPTGLDETHTFEWVSQRKGRTGNWSEFSPPAIFAQRGIDGRPGERTQTWYRPTTTETKPPNIVNSAALRANDQPTITGWSTIYPSLSDVNRFVWASEREGTSGSWGNFGEVHLVARQGRDGDPGQDAIDAREYYPFSYRMTYDSRLGNATGTTNTWGNWQTPTTYESIAFDNDAFPANTDTEESVYRLSNSNTTPPSITNSANNNFVPSGWNAARQLPTATQRFLYRATRTRASATATWGNFNTPEIAATRSTTPTSNTDTSTNQYIYFASPNSQQPDTPPSGGINERAQSYELIPTGWTDNAPALTWDNPYTFQSLRTATPTPNREIPSGRGQYQLIGPTNGTVNQATEIWLSNNDLDGSSPRQLYDRLRTGDTIAIGNETDTVREEFLITDIIHQSEPPTGPTTAITAYTRLIIAHTNTQKGASANFPIPPLAAT